MFHRVDVNKNSVVKDNTVNTPGLFVSSEPASQTVIQLSEDESPVSKPKHTSLRTKAVALAVAIGTIPILSIGAIAYYVAHQSVEKEIVNAKEISAVALANNVSRFMASRYGDLKVLTNQRIFVNKRIRDVATKEDKEARMNNLKDAYQAYDNIAVLDLDGNVLYQTKGEPLSNERDLEYFKTVVKTDQSYVTQPSNATDEDNNKIYLASPIKDSETNQTIFIGRFVMPVKALEEIVKSQVGKYDYNLIDTNGKIFLSSEKSHLATKSEQHFPGIEELHKNRQVDTKILIDKKDNVEEFVTYAPWQKNKGIPDLNWKVMLTADTNIAFESPRRLLLFLQLGVLATATLVGVIAAIAANKLTKPILAASNTIKKIGKGDLETRVPVKGKDELATLGFNINQMADQLQDLLQQKSTEAEQLKQFTNILIALRQAPNTEDLLNTTVTEVRTTLGADRVVIYRVNSNGGGEVIAESVASSLPQALGESEDPCISQSLIEAYKNGRVVAVNNVYEAGYSSEHVKFLEKLQVYANLITPVVKDNQLFGFLIAHHCWGPHLWQAAEINFTRQLALQVGLSLERVSLLETTQSLKELAVHMSGTLDTKEIYQLAVQDIRKAIKADRVVIFQFDENLDAIPIAESVVAGFPCIIGIKQSDYCLKDYINKYRTGKTLVINNVYQANLSDCYLQQLESFAVKSNMVAPLLVGDRLLGLLIANQCSKPRTWHKSEIDLFEQFARQVSMALERASLLEATEEALETAEKVSLQQLRQKEAIQKQLIMLLNEIEGAADGDLTVRADVTAGEIGTVADFFNSIIENLRDIVTQVKDTASQVNGAINKNESAIRQLADTAIKQSAEINRSLESVDKMTTSIKSVAESARQAAIVARTASYTAESGGTAMDLTVENILSLRETIGETAKKVKRLGESSQQISRVVSLINQIALQTNLLAINAGIEAARAGDGGQGFAVVAEEVAALAVRSSAATHEIEGIVANIQMETNEVVKAMELGTTQVVEGTRLVGDTKQSLHKILDVCHEIDELVQSISSATVSQAQTSQSVTQLMKEVAKVSELTSHSSRQISESLQKTVHISQDLQTTVGTFKVS